MTEFRKAVTNFVSSSGVSVRTRFASCPALSLKRVANPQGILR